jgi:hypothetical protein
MFHLPLTSRQFTPTRLACCTAFLSLAMAGSALAGDSIVLTPANSIQAAINSGQYTEIILEPGMYNQTIIVDAADAPMTLRSMDPMDPETVAATVLDGEFLSTSIILLTSGVGGDVVVDGLTFVNGEADGSSAPENRGGAIDCETASPTVRRCVFLDNEAQAVGGALYVNAGSMTIEDCRFEGNLAQWGGALYCNNSTVDVVRCRFESNDATIEGGACRLYTGSYGFDQCDFFDNTSVEYGGAVVNRHGAMLTVTRCLFDSNFSGDGGSLGRGGALMHDGSDNASIENSVFRNNSATRYGASVYTFQTITVRGATFFGDTVDGGGAVVFAITQSAHLNLYNSILWNFTGGAAIETTVSRVVAYCNIQGGYPGEGNIGGESGDEPAFADAAGGDFRLLAGSAGIDAGDARKVLGEYPVDYNGDPRALNDPDTADSGIAVLGIAVDMGAFEYQPEDSGNETCPADLTGDGAVNVFDLLDLLSAWGTCP